MKKLNTPVRGDIKASGNIFNFQFNVADCMILMDMLIGNDNKDFMQISKNPRNMEMMCSYICGSPDVENDPMFVEMQMRYPEMFTILRGARQTSMENECTTIQAVIEDQRRDMENTWNNMDDDDEMMFGDDPDMGMSSGTPTPSMNMS